MDSKVQELIDLVQDLGMASAERLLNVHRTTISRWMKRQTRVPDAALLTLRAAVKGQLPGQTDRTWQGWSFDKYGTLWSPGGDQFTSGDLMAQRYERAVIRELRKEIAQLEAKLIKMTKAASMVDQAANDIAISGPLAKAYG